MFRIKPYSEKEFAEIERRGFGRFLCGYSLESLVVYFFIFSAINFVVHFDQQTDLIRTGALSSLLLAPASSLIVWMALKARYGKPRSTH